MALPRIDTPTYQTNLPSTGQTIQFRPFLVKEQKIIMMAQETQDEEHMLRAMSDLVSSCTFNQIDVNNLPIYDVEYIFLRIRGKSVGETVELNLICPDDEETKVPVTINLEDINIIKTEGHSETIMITDSIGLTMKHPTMKQIMSYDLANMDGIESSFGIINDCLVNVFNQDEVWEDWSDKEVQDFIEQMTTDQFVKVTNFFTTMPKLKHIVKVTNPNTGVESEVALEGMQSFLE